MFFKMLTVGEIIAQLPAARKQIALSRLKPQPMEITAVGDGDNVGRRFRQHVAGSADQTVREVGGVLNGEILAGSATPARSAAFQPHVQTWRFYDLRTRIR